MEEYLTVAEVAARLKWKSKTVHNRMSQGVFILGIHYFKRKGIGPRFKWSAVTAWLEGGDPRPADDGIRMTGGYILGNGLTVEADEEYRP